MRSYRLVLALVVVALLGTACFSAPGGGGAGGAALEDRRPEENAGPPQPGGAFRYALPSDARSLDPHRESSFNTHIAIGSTYSKLVDFKTGPDVPYGAPELEGDLAESWETSPDGTTWTFHLRQGVRFHDVAPVNGREFTSDDVMCTLQRIRELPGHQVSQLAMVQEAGAPDPYTVVFRLTEPYAEFDTNLAGHFMWMLPCEATRGEFDVSTTAIGTGPYVLERWERDRERVLTAHPDYYVEGQPYIERIEISIVPDQAAAIAAFRTGQTDFLSALSLDLAQAERILTEDPEAVLFREQGLTQTRLYMNQAREPFDDVRVRRAIALAIDRQGMVDTIRAGGSPTAAVTPTLFGGLPSEEAARLQPHDPEQARALLAEAGFPQGFSTRMILTDGYGENVVREAQWVQQDLAEIGIQVELVLQDYATYFTESFAGENYDMGYGLQTPMLSADDYLSSEWASDGPRNWYGISDPALDQMINEQRGELDRATREEQLHEIQRYIMENVSNPVPLYVYDGLSIYAPYLHDAWPHPDYGTRHQARMWLGPEAPGRA
ncbi:ABC transporter substrate-binding protein [Pseudonocardia kunmingensis]|uniref:Peptide/nickel transport system substrate-binding protein n=1 Tax=Pseudonocardia kunmingensis TaxID=630975 RepID=A0A543DZS7_9PSEU|nr:ABC transporter substrate-binding protein [Pseudonocardia kunmingensis]TQM14828.1 peptide/nickel transport system substrate-binding protein [Pseudonocardia kunmingensis]